VVTGCAPAGAQSKAENRGRAEFLRWFARVGREVGSTGKGSAGKGGPGGIGVVGLPERKEDGGDRINGLTP